MTAARLIVVEDVGRWAVALRWALAESDIWVHTAATLDECLGMLQQAPASLVGLPLTTDDLERTWRSLQLLQRAFPACGILVLADGGMEAAGPFFYEAGALHFVNSARNLNATSRLIQRFLQAVADAPTFREHVWRRMPWNDDPTAKATTLEG